MKLLRSVSIFQCLLFITQNTIAQNPFITTWDAEFDSANDTVHSQYSSTYGFRYFPICRVSQYYK